MSILMRNCRWESRMVSDVVRRKVRSLMLKVGRLMMRRGKGLESVWWILPEVAYCGWHLMEICQSLMS